MIPKLTAQDNEHIMRFASCFYATMDQMWMIRDKMNMTVKYRMQNLQSQGELFLKQMQSGMSEVQRQQFEIYSMYGHEVLNEAFKAKDKAEFLAIIKAYNEGDIKIDQKEILSQTNNTATQNGNNQNGPSLPIDEDRSASGQEV